MQNLKKLIAEKINILSGNAIEKDEIESLLSYPPDDSMGDLALPCFKFAKALRKSPVMIAEEFAGNLKDGFIKKTEAVNGYLNIFIDDSYWTSVLIPKILSEKENYGKNDSGKGKTAVIDYSAPNLCKPFHVGHLRSTIVGHTLKNLYEYNGWKCVGINYLGDWGTQFGKQIAAYKMWGTKEQIEKGGVEALASLYVRFNNEAEDNPEFQQMARDEFRKLEEKDSENTELWKWFVEISLAECEKSYKLLGVTFDSYAGESFYSDKMPAQIEVMKNSGILKIDNGATIVDLEKYGMPPCLILKSDGSTLYPTRDIAAAYYRKTTYKSDLLIYVTAYQQCLHFKQWFKVIGLMGYDFENELVHVPYGMVSCNGAKLATRTGNVVLIKDLISSSVGKVTEIMKEKNPDLPDLEKVAEEVGVGAIVFYFLMNGRIKDIDFSLDEALSFEGNTGPYAQYTYARCSSILEKAGSDSECDSPSGVYTEKDESELAKALSRFPETVVLAAKEFEPSVIARYILDLCAYFNRFYHSCPIMTAEKEDKERRLALVKATKNVLASALHIICMKTPAKI